jgi:hypothetical protein
MKEICRKKLLDSSLSGIIVGVPAKPKTNTTRLSAVNLVSSSHKYLRNCREVSATTITK